MSTIDFKALTAPFPYSRLRWRVSKTSEDKKQGLVLPYLDPRDVQARLDEVLTPQGWQVSYAPALVGGGFLCTLQLWINDQWVGKSDLGRYDSPADRANRSQPPQNSEREAVALSENSIKGGASDAFKRAAVLWGIGRYLYHFEPLWVSLSERGRRLASYPPISDELLPESERGQEPWKAMQAALEAGASGARAGVVLARTPDSAPFQSSASGDMQDPSSPGSRRAGPVRAVCASEDAPLIGTEEDWRALSEEDRRAIAVLDNRLRTGTELKGVEEFLQGSRGEALPSWVRQALLTKLNAVHEDQRAAA